MNLELPYNRQSSTGAIDVSNVKTFILNGVDTPLGPADEALLNKAAENPDQYMPFRSHAPSAQCLRALFGDQYPGILLTNLGLQNLVATRYISYNSPFLLSGEQKFATRVEDLSAMIYQEPEQPVSDFMLDHLPNVWNSCTWPRSMGRNFMSVWHAFSIGVGRTDKRYKIPHVGPLLALQICGMISRFNEVLLLTSLKETTLLLISWMLRLFPRWARSYTRST